MDREPECNRIGDGIATVGITDFPQDELGDVVLVEPPEGGIELQGSPEPLFSEEASGADRIDPFDPVV